MGTPIRKDTLDPAFDTQLVFYVKNPEDATVKVQVSIIIIIVQHVNSTIFIAFILYIIFFQK